MSIPYASLNLGVLEWLITTLVDIFMSLVQVVITLLTNIFAGLLYEVGVQLMWLANFAQSLFRRLAGLESIWYNGVQDDTEPLIKLISDQSVMEVFLALLFVGIVMLMMATIIQIIRVEYTTEGSKNSKGNIVGQALKSLAMFVIVPVGAVLGIYLSNMLLQMIDTATNPSNSTTISGAIFTAAAGEANRVRLSNPDTEEDDWFASLISRKGISVDDQGVISDDANNYNGGVEKFETSIDDATKRRNYLAEKVDAAFAEGWINNNQAGDYDAEHLGATFDVLNSDIVGAYYDLGKVNYIILYVASGLAVWSLYMASFGLIMRLYKATILFVISPPIVAIMPLDNGNAYKQWAKTFLGAVIGAYGVVVTLNLFFIILPLLKNIQLFDPTSPTNYYFNNFTYLLFVIVGCYMFKDMSSMISSIIGAEDALGAGTTMAGKATSMAASLTPIGGALAATRGIKSLTNRASANSAEKKANAALASGDTETAKQYMQISGLKRAKSESYMKKMKSNAGIGFVTKAAGGVAGAAGLGDVYDMGVDLTKGGINTLERNYAGSSTDKQIERDLNRRMSHNAGLSVKKDATGKTLRNADGSLQYVDRAGNDAEMYKSKHLSFDQRMTEAVDRKAAVSERNKAEMEANANAIDGYRSTSKDLTSQYGYDSAMLAFKRAAMKGNINEAESAQRTVIENAQELMDPNSERMADLLQAMHSVLTNIAKGGTKMTSSQVNGYFTHGTLSAGNIVADNNKIADALETGNGNGISGDMKLVNEFNIKVSAIDKEKDKSTQKFGEKLAELDKKLTDMGVNAKEVAEKTKKEAERRKAEDAATKKLMEEIAKKEIKKANKKK